MLEGGLKVEEFKLSDLSRILEIERSSFGLEAYSKETFIYWYLRSPEFFLVARVNNYIVGYIIADVHRLEGHIVSIAVDNSFRRRGIGKLLVENVLNRMKLKNVRIVKIEVKDKNFVGISFWKSLGFHKVGKIPNYYPDGSDAIVMEKELL